MLGIVHEAVIFLLEQLYGSRHCHNYRFRFHKPDETDEPSINPHGSARAEINHRFEKKKHTHTHKYTLYTAIKLSVHHVSKHPQMSHACLCFWLQKVCVWHVQFLGFQTSPASRVQASWRWRWWRAPQDCQVRVHWKVSLSFPELFFSLATVSLLLLFQTRLYRTANDCAI